MTSTRLALVLAILMSATSVVVSIVKASATVAEQGPAIQLDKVIPRQFGRWQEEKSRLVAVVNPQTQQLLEKLYSQVLTRVYVDTQGYRVMLSLAYGDDQRGGLQAHKPEVCYPAQGFTLDRNEQADIVTSFGRIPGRRLGTRLGSRVEPVTYWFAVADKAVTTRFEHRMAEIRLGLTGKVPYGLLFRVSSIDADQTRAYREHERFVNDLLAVVSPMDRMRLSGLVGTD